MIINKILPTLFLIFTCAAASAEEKNYFRAGREELKAETKKYDPVLSDKLIYRVAFGKADDVKILLEKGADPHAKNIADIPVLQIAVVRKDDEAPGIVKNLINGGANVNAVSKNGNTAVLEAVKNGRADILQILIDAHAVLGLVRDAQGYDLLSIAESRGNLDIVKILHAGLDAEKDKLEALKSQGNFINLIQQYAYLSCANEYLNFYISNQPGTVNMVAFNKVITGNSEEIGQTSGQLKMLFKMNNAELLQIQNSSRGQVLARLKYYETNQNRELNGIGTDEDLNNRCWKIARKWNASKMNLEQYRQNTK